jgi:hypothetical protein
MIGYVTVGTNDLKKASAFYDRICGDSAWAGSWKTSV